MDRQQISQEQPIPGCMLDEDGREIPITEQMIQDACRQLEQQAPYPQQAEATQTS